MPIRDPFSYSGRWDSVGLDCSNCVHFKEPKLWPDSQKLSHCKLHKISLSIELGKNGYKEGEWFCKDFQSNGTANQKAVKEFQTVKDHLESRKLYRAYGGAFNGNAVLKEYNFNNLKSSKRS
jgi:hypothetical protein